MPVEVTIDNVQVNSEHVDPTPIALTVIPEDFTPGTFVPGVQFVLSEPLFSDPSATILMGPGLLVENLEILDDFTAIADVTVGLRALPTCHTATLDTPDRIFQGPYGVDCPKSNLCPLDDNELPFGELQFEPDPSGFTVTLLFDDPNNDIIQAEIAIESLPDEEILFTSAYRTYRTDLSDPNPEMIQFVVPELAPGAYVALGILDDGLSIAHIVEVPFSIGGTIPTVSEWGLIVMLLLSLTAGTIVFARRRRTTLA